MGASESGAGAVPGEKPRTGPVMEVTATGNGVSPEGTGLPLRWAAPPGRSADLETADGEMRGFLVADGRGSGGQLYAAYRVAAAGSAPEVVMRHGDVASGLTAILGPPQRPRTGYAATRRAAARRTGQRPARTVPGSQGPGRAAAEAPPRQRPGQTADEEPGR